jgi:hypothetical protein
MWVLGAAVAWAQPLNFDSLDKLKAKASETVNITLDGSMLQTAGKFLSNDDPDNAQIKKLVSGLKRIVVRSFEFEHTGEYLESDLDAVRGQLRDPSWKKIVEFRSKTDDNSDVYVKNDADRIVGLVVVAAEPKELTVVQIDGPLDMEGLAKLAGNFGIPDSVKHRVEKKMEGKTK